MPQYLITDISLHFGALIFSMLSSLNISLIRLPLLTSLLMFNFLDYHQYFDDNSRPIPPNLQYNTHLLREGLIVFFDHYNIFGVLSSDYTTLSYIPVNHERDRQHKPIITTKLHASYFNTQQLFYDPLLITSLLEGPQGYAIH